MRRRIEIGSRQRWAALAMVNALASLSGCAGTGEPNSLIALAAGFARAIFAAFVL